MKAILENGKLKYQNQFSVLFDLNENQTSTNGMTDEVWINHGFKEVVEPIYDSNTQFLSDWIETETEITKEIINKTDEVIQEELYNYIKYLILSIESDTDDLIREVIGERANEYLIAEQEAVIFKEAGYPELDIPLSISSDMVANNRTAQEACDLILLMAENWKTIQGVLRAKRLMTKAQIKQIKIKADAEVIITEWNDFITSLRAQIID